MGKRIWIPALLAILLAGGCERVAAPALGTLGAIAAPGGGGRVVGFVIGFALGLAVDYGVTQLLD